MCYQIVFGLVKLSFTDFFAFRLVTVTRGHQYKLYVNHSRGIKKHFFTERVAAPWNSMPADTDFSSLSRFKCCINAVDFRKFLTVGVYVLFLCFLVCVLFLYKLYYCFLRANLSAVYQPFRPCFGCTYLHCTALFCVRVAIEINK